MKISTRHRVVALGVLLCLGFAATARDKVPSDAIDILWFQAIPLRDGVKLSAAIYVPKSPQQQVGCVAHITPYIASGAHAEAKAFAAQGIAFASVDSRGRGDSAGDFQPFKDEGRDGYDVVEWLAAQPYCKHRVGLWGQSYGGYEQWAVAKELPPHLTTIVPTVAAYLGLDYPMRNNIPYPFSLQWLVLVGGHAGHAAAFSDDDYWSMRFLDWYRSGRAYRELPVLFNAPGKYFEEWLNHPEQGAYWDAYNPSPEQISKMTFPILSLTGQYDDDQPGALEHYRAFMRSASALEKSRHYLVIGPWDHGGTCNPTDHVGGLLLGKASMIDMRALEREWYAWTMGAGPKPAFLEKQVTYYVTGLEKWKYADTLDAVTTSLQSYFFKSSGVASDVLGGGSLQLEQSTGEPDEYVYDPRDTSGPELMNERRIDPSSVLDQSRIYALSGRELVYYTAPLQRDQEVSGFFDLSAWISIDRPDTDLYVAVDEIRTDGSSVRLSTDAMRARYRQSFRQSTLIGTRDPLVYEFKHFTFVSRRLQAGSRIRLVIAPMGRLVDATFAERNFNTGGEVAAETARDGRPVTVKLYHDASHASVLHVPLGST